MNTSFNDTQNLPFSDRSPEALQSANCLERRLEISEARIGSLLARLPQIVWLAQVDGEITEFNQRWYEYTGLTPVESLGWEFLKAVHPEDRARFVSSCNLALEQSPSYDLECRLLGADGTYHWFVAQAMPVLGGDDQLLEWVGTFTLKGEYRSSYEEEQGKQRENVLPPVAGKLLSMDLSKGFASPAYEPTAHQEFCSITTQLAVGDRHPANLRIRKQAAAKTTELAKNRLPNLVKDLSHTIIWEADATTEQYTFVSSSAERVLGYPVEQWLSEPDFWVKLIHPEDRQWTVALCRKEIYQSRDYELEYRCLAADNRIVWLRDRAYMVRDHQGQVHKRRGLMVDITLAKQAETELLTRCRQQAIIVQLGQKALLGTKISSLLEEAVSLVSQALAVEYCKVMELLPDDNTLRLRAGVGWQEGLVGQVAISGSPDTDAGYTLHCRQPVIVEDLRRETRFRGSSLLHDHDVVSGMSVVIEAKPYPGSLDSTSINRAYRPFGVLGAYTNRQRAFKGSELDFLQSVAHVLGAAIEHQQADEALYEVRDKLAQTTTILNQTRAELEKRTRELEQFAYVASHDLKAPIRAIANLSEWIEEDISSQLDPENLYQMQLLRRRVYRLEALMEGLLQYSRAGRIKVNSERVDVESLLRQVIDILEPPPQFTVEIAPGMPTLLTEPLLLQEVFTHLIGNAIKHHPSPTGTVTIDVRERADTYEFAVTDDGEGIAPQFQERVFVIFQTLQARDEVENTGIGLAIVKKIVESRGGIIQVESQEGRGARFSFTWPIRK